MTVIIRLQNLPWTANALDIRRFFQGLAIPDGGVHIVGGEKGDAFIAFSTDDDARQAMYMDAGRINDCPLKLMLSSKTEMQNVIAIARGSGPSGGSNMGMNETNRLAQSAGPSAPQSGGMGPGMNERGMHNLPSGNQQFGSPSQNRVGNGQNNRDNRGVGMGGNANFSHNQGGQFDRGIGHRGGENIDRMRGPEETRGAPPPIAGDMQRPGDNAVNVGMDMRRGGRGGGSDWNVGNNRMIGGNDRGRGRNDRARADRGPMGMGSDRMGGQFDRRSESEHSGGGPGRMGHFERSGSVGRARMGGREHMGGSGDRIGAFAGGREDMEYNEQRHDHGRMGSRERVDANQGWNNGDGYNKYEGSDRLRTNEESGGFRGNQGFDRFRGNEGERRFGENEGEGRFGGNEGESSFGGNERGVRFGETDGDDRYEETDQPIEYGRRHERFADRKEVEQRSHRHHAYEEEYEYPDQQRDDNWDQSYEEPREYREDIPDIRHMDVGNYRGRDEDNEMFQEDEPERFERQDMYDNDNYDNQDDFRGGYRHDDYDRGDFEEMETSRDMDFQRDEFSRPQMREDQDQRFNQERSFEGHNMQRRGFGSRMRGMGRGSFQQRGGRFDSRKREREQQLYVFASSMPETVSYKDVRRFFTGCEIPHDGLKLINDKQGNRNGTAFVKFTKEQDCYHALKRNGQMMGNARIHIERCRPVEFDNATDSYVPGSNPNPSRGYSPPTKRNRSRSPMARAGHDGSNCVILRNVHFRATRLDIRQFLGSCKIKENGGPHIELGKDGRPTGIAFVELDTKADFEEALKQNKRMFMRRPVDITSISKKEFEMQTQKDANESDDKRQVEIKDETREKEKKEERSGNNSALGSKDDEKKFFCVKMRGLPFSSTSNSVREFFEGLGIANRGIHVVTNRQGQAAGVAYVEFVTSTDCKKAIEKDKHYMGKRYIDITPITKKDMLEEISVEHQKVSGGPSNSARPPALKGIPDLPGIGRPGCTITMSNLPFKVQLEDIMTFLQECRPIQDSVRLRYSKDGKPTGDAMVAFHSANDAQRAIHELNRKMMMGRLVALALAP